MTWTFMLVVSLLVPTPQRGAIAEAVHISSREECIGYAQGRLSMLPAPHTALCVNHRTGEIIDVKRQLAAGKSPRSPSNDR